MKKGDRSEEMRPEYQENDLGVGMRGKFFEAYNESHNLVLLQPEVVEAFPTEEAVNEALLSLIRIAKASAGATKDASGRS